MTKAQQKYNTTTEIPLSNLTSNAYDSDALERSDPTVDNRSHDCSSATLQNRSRIEIETVGQFMNELVIQDCLVTKRCEVQISNSIFDTMRAICISSGSASETEKEVQKDHERVCDLVSSFRKSKSESERWKAILREVLTNLHLDTHHVRICFQTERRYWKRLECQLRPSPFRSARTRRKATTHPQPTLSPSLKDLTSEPTAEMRPTPLRSARRMIAVKSGQL